jgi:hypothetical protein
MADIEYKQYTDEEGMIYEEAIRKIRKAIEDGSTFSEACSMTDVKDPELKRLIEEDALKIIIADLHYGKGVPLQQMAGSLKITLKRLNIAAAEMLEDVGTTAAAIYRQNNPDGYVGNA